jgi:hypothetical protein
LKKKKYTHTYLNTKIIHLVQKEENIVLEVYGIHKFIYGRGKYQLFTNKEKKNIVDWATQCTTQFTF